MRVLSESSLTDLLMAKPATVPILPQIERLFVDGELCPEFPWCRFLAGFLHDNLQDIAICIDNRLPNIVVGFLDEASWRSPNITSLTIEAVLDTFETDVGDSLSNSLQTMQKLTEIYVQSCLLPPRILSSLEQLPALQAIFFLADSYRCGRKSSGLLPRSVRPNSFPSLQTVTFAEFDGGIEPISIGGKWCCSSTAPFWLSTSSPQMTRKCSENVSRKSLMPFRF